MFPREPGYRGKIRLQRRPGCLRAQKGPQTLNTFITELQLRSSSSEGSSNPKHLYPQGSSSATQESGPVCRAEISAPLRQDLMSFASHVGYQNICVGSHIASSSSTHLSARLTRQTIFKFDPKSFLLYKLSSAYMEFVSSKKIYSNFSLLSSSPDSLGAEVGSC